MAIEISVIHNGRGILQYTQGHIDGDQMVAENVRFFRDETAHLLKADYWISDFSDVTTADVSVDHVKQIALLTLDASKQKSDLWVGLCSPQSLIYGLSRMWIAMADATGWESHVKHTQAEIKAALEEHLGEPVPDWLP